MSADQDLELSRWQRRIERLAEGLDTARRREPCAQEASDALAEVMQIVLSGREAIGVPAIVVTQALPEMTGIAGPFRKVNGSGG